MATWDQRDPRWLVEQRADGRNVNQWHWEEKSIKGKVQDRLSELFSDLALDIGGKPGSFKISSLKETSGDASLNVRKGNKLLAIYDLKLTLAWEGQLAGSEERVTGTVKVDEFASASDEDDYLFEFLVDGGAADAKEQARRLMANHAKPQIIRQLLVLVRELSSIGSTPPPS
uniref:Activator of Hsp90 ATPase AHSA1-like N-terminal domain-containing protein n=1 Tax=Dunaliella tertiolecta TaxID=3047 RepID=A0A7S3VHP0_DUNTE|mmetsp:Transcript_22574/g.62358  ORF Transcript_22574/g.62358 Transcript_22574/m.62358 type:complete len:172 (+) Transcript_22574:186-701(+)